MSTYKMKVYATKNVFHHNLHKYTNRQKAMRQRFPIYFRLFIQT